MWQFSIKEALTFGWETFKKYPWFLIVVTLIVGVVPYAVQYVLQLPFSNNPQQIGPNFDPNGAYSQEWNPMMLIGTIASSLVSAYLTIGVIRISLKLVDGKKPELNDLYSAKAEEFIRYVIGGLLYGLIVIAGYILLIIPGVIFTIKYQYYSYLIIDKHFAPVDAIKESGKITQGYKLNLFLFGIVIALVTLLGFLALIVGILVAAPVTGLAQAYVYRKLASQKATK